jgi:hypothetical protein
MTDFGPGFRFALSVLATWRLTHLLSQEDGPADLIFKLRRLLGASLAGKLMDCFYCLSVWVAAPLAWLVAPRLIDGLLTWLALSGAACLLHRLVPEPRAPVVIHQLPPEGESNHVVLRTESGDPQDGTIGARHRQ